MQQKLVKFSALADNLQTLKLRNEGVWVFAGIFKSMEELVTVASQTPVLVHNFEGFVFAKELEKLVTTLDNILRLEISQISPAASICLLEACEDLRVKIRTLLFESTEEHSIFSQKEAASKLSPIVETLFPLIQSLVNQSRSNFVAAADLYAKETIEKLGQNNAKLRARYEFERLVNQWSKDPRNPKSLEMAEFIKNASILIQEPGSSLSGTLKMSNSGI